MRSTATTCTEPNRERIVGNPGNYHALFGRLYLPQVIEIDHTPLDIILVNDLPIVFPSVEPSRGSTLRSVRPAKTGRHNVEIPGRLEFLLITASQDGGWIKTGGASSGKEYGLLKARTPKPLGRTTESSC